VAKEAFDISGIQTGFTFNSDLSPYDMPPNMFSTVKNIRFNDGKASSILGHSQVLGTPSAAPYWTTSWRQGSTDLWIYGGLTDLYKISGTTHSSVTRSSGSYTTLSGTDNNWQGGVLGGVLVVNNGLDLPQSFTQGGSQFTDLPNWPSTLKCEVIVPFRNHLIALNLNDNGTLLPYSIRWSDAIPEGAADNGADTWNTGSTSSESAQTTVGATKGHLRNALPLGNELIIYKEDSIYSLTYTGGTFVFTLREKFKDVGLFARDAVAQINNNQHVFVTTNDIVVFNGSSVKSIVDESVKKYFFSQIDSTYFYKTFVVHNQAKNEVWICYPKTGATSGLPNEALIWNYLDNTWSIRELPSVNYIAKGLVNPVASDTWASSTELWYQPTTKWAEESYNPSVFSLLMCGTNDTKLYKADSGLTFDGTNVSPYIERIGLRTGSASMIRDISEVYPRFEGQGTVNISIGTEIRPNEGVSYQDPVTFTIGTDEKIDCRVRGRFMAIKIEGLANTQFDLSGYTVISEVVGDR
jgi:hypothetical protein